MAHQVTGDLRCPSNTVLLRGRRSWGKPVHRGGCGLLVGTLLLGSVACSNSAREPAPQVTVDTLASGAVRVSSSAAGAWRAGEEWRLVEELRLGSVEGDGLDVFGEVHALEVDELGRIYVLDALAHEIRVFEADGTSIRAVGNRGSGPGELLQPAALTWGPDGNLWVLDFGNGRWTVFDTAGVHVGQEPRPITSLQMPWPGGFDRQGHLVDVLGSGQLVRSRPGETARETFSLALDPVELFEVRTEQAQLAALVPFAPRPVWLLDHDGFVWYGTGARYAIARRTLQGDTVLIVSRDHEPEAVTDADRRDALARLGWAEEQGLELDPGRIPNVKPAYVDFFTDDLGYLWVATSEVSMQELSAYGTFDVFDAAGAYLGEVESDTPVFPFIRPVVRGGHLYAVHLGDMHVMHVVRFRILGRS